MCRRTGDALNHLGSRRASARREPAARLRFAGVSVLLVLKVSVVFVARDTGTRSPTRDELPVFIWNRPFAADNLPSKCRARPSALRNHILHHAPRPARA